MERQPLLSDGGGGYMPQQQPPPQGLPQYQGEVPQEDVSEKADVQPPQASAPPMDGLQMAGYETATFQGAYVPPPPYQPSASDIEQDAAGRGSQPDIQVISEEEAQAALLGEAGEHCCWGKKAAQNMVVTRITPSSAFHRHWVRVVPVAEVDSNFNGKPFTYWVYGHNTRVYAPNYPQKCCCGCTLL